MLKIILCSKEQKNADRQQRQDAVNFVEASNALEGYPPLDPQKDVVAYDLRIKWINGEITDEEHVQILLDGDVLEPN